MATDADDPPVLQLQNLAVQFPLGRAVLRAVDGVDLTLRRGRTTCIVGESGSGKSVTARAIMQIVGRPGRIASGRILYQAIAGQPPIDLAGLPPHGKAMRALRGRDIAMIFQEPMTSLSPVHRIGWQVGEPLLAHGLADRATARRRAIDLLRQVEIPDPEAAVQRFPFEFSGGMRQRAMIAMALACAPKILIADEPTTALDVTTQAEILRLIRRLQQQTGLAVLFITHDMGVVAQIADDVLVMHGGRVVERGDVETIFHAPTHPYTQRLLEASRKLGMAAPPARRNATFGRPVLRVSQLGMTYPQRGSLFRRAAPAQPAISNIALELYEGENLGIVGESGSGKTTVGNCLIRLLQPTTGRIEYTARDGRMVELTTLGRAGLRRVHREVRMVFQDPFASLNPRMTVGQIVAEPLHVNGLAGGAALGQRVAALLTSVGLPPDAASRYPHAFSGGQRQRIVIARALALEPRLVIADEATSALDVTLRGQILDLLLEMQSRLGLSFILISHDLGVIRYFCDRVAVMHRGEIVETGPAAQICGAPSHPYTKALLAAVPAADPRHRTLLSPATSRSPPA